MNSLNGNTGSISIYGQNFFNCSVTVEAVASSPYHLYPAPPPGFPWGAPGLGGFGPGGFNNSGFNNGGFGPGGAGAVAAPLPGGAQQQPAAAMPAVVQPGPVHPALAQQAPLPAPIGVEPVNRIVIDITGDEPVDLQRLAVETRQNADRAEQALALMCDMSATDAAARRLHEQRMGAAVEEALNQQRSARQHAADARASSVNAAQNANAAAQAQQHSQLNSTLAMNFSAAAQQQADVARQARRWARRYADDADVHADAAQRSMVDVQAGVRAVGDQMAQASSVRRDAQDAARRAEAAAQRGHPGSIIVMDWSSDDDDAPAVAPAAAAPVRGPARAHPYNLRPRRNAGGGSGSGGGR